MCIGYNYEARRLKKKITPSVSEYCPLLRTETFKIYDVLCCRKK